MGREDAAAQCCGREEKELWGGKEGGRRCARTRTTTTAPRCSNEVHRFCCRFHAGPQSPRNEEHSLEQ